MLTDPDVRSYPCDRAALVVPVIVEPLMTSCCAVSVWLADLSIPNVLVAAVTLLTTVEAWTPVPRTFMPTLTPAMFATLVTLVPALVRLPVVTIVASKPCSPGSTPMIP